MISKSLKTALLSALLLIPAIANAGWVKTTNGLSADHLGEKLSITFINSDVVRVMYVPEGEMIENETNVLVDYPVSKVKIKYSEDDESVKMTSEKLTVTGSKKSGAVQIFDAEGNILMQENGSKPRTSEQVDVRNVVYDDSKSTIEKTANGDVKISEIASAQTVDQAWKSRVNFVWQKGEALYGLGSHQEPHYNLRGTMQYLYQHNIKATVPVLMSYLGYGLLFNVGSTMEFHDDEAGSYMEMHAVKSIDY
ncbi:MAG: DUF4968 domain-containing protein, partial [Bacteroidaceae bacterium]|nr:DUF4968 domain-containing protein [Bacteroidaceae bacterium]